MQKGLRDFSTGGFRRLKTNFDSKVCFGKFRPELLQLQILGNFSSDIDTKMIHKV